MTGHYVGVHRWQVAFGKVQVGPAHAAGTHADEHLPGARLRIRQLGRPRGLPLPPEHHRAFEAKFGIDLGTVLNAVSKYGRAGLLERVDDNGPGLPALYGAGPALLAAIRSGGGEIVEAA